MKTKLQLSNKTTEEVVEVFKDMALQQAKALFDGDSKKYNRIFDQMLLVQDELKSRPGDQRRALIPFYNHPSPQVRLKAAIYTLALEPDGARRTLQLIWDRGEFPEAAYAKGILDSFDEGRYVPS